MPIYEYECLKCAKTFDARQGFNDPDLTNCRFCGEEVRRLFCPPAIIFKGKGWYVNEFPTADRKKGLAADKKAGGDKKTDSKKKTPPPACSASCNKPSCV